jgi:hypothetical protein
VARGLWFIGHTTGFGKTKPISGYAARDEARGTRGGGQLCETKPILPVRRGARRAKCAKQTQFPESWAPPGLAWLGGHSFMQNKPNSRQGQVGRDLGDAGYRANVRNEPNFAGPDGAGGA